MAPTWAVPGLFRSGSAVGYTLVVASFVEASFLGVLCRHLTLWWHLVSVGCSRNVLNKERSSSFTCWSKPTCCWSMANLVAMLIFVVLSVRVAILPILLINGC